MATLALDPEYAEALKQVLSTLEIPPRPEVGDVSTRRANINKLMKTLLQRLPSVTDVDEILIGSAKSHDGFNVPLYHFSRTDSDITLPGPAVVYIHGGGYFCLSVEIYKPLLRTYVSLSGISLFAVEYRLPPEHPFPTPVEDCFAGLKHVSDNATYLGVDRTRIMLMGDSAGGGLCAGTAILARDRNISLAKQIVTHGNIDDRTVDPESMPELADFATWSIEDNITGWDAYLGPGHEFRGDIAPSAAPARLESMRGLAPLYLDVPSLDILRDEGIKYAERAAEASVSVELHVYPGVPHGFELFCPDFTMSKMVMQNRLRAMKSV